MTGAPHAVVMSCVILSKCLHCGTNKSCLLPVLVFNRKVQFVLVRSSNKMYIYDPRTLLHPVVKLPSNCFITMVLTTNNYYF